MFSTRSAAVNPRSLVEPVAHVIAVEQRGVRAVRIELRLDDVGDRRLARAREAGEPSIAGFGVLRRMRLARHRHAVPVHIGRAPQSMRVMPASTTKTFCAALRVINSRRIPFFWILHF